MYSQSLKYDVSVYWIDGHLCFPLGFISPVAMRWQLFPPKLWIGWCQYNGWCTPSFWSAIIDIIFTCLFEQYKEIIINLFPFSTLRVNCTLTYFVERRNRHASLLSTLLNWLISLSRSDAFVLPSSPEVEEWCQDEMHARWSSTVVEINLKKISRQKHGFTIQ